MATKVCQQISFKIEQHEPGLSSGHGTELKSPKRIQNKTTKAFAEPTWIYWKWQQKPKYSEQIYLDLRSYQEKLSGKLPTNSKASTLGPWRALKSRPRAKGPCGKFKSECRKLANKWPGHFSMKIQNQDYKPRLLAWAFWAQIRAQEQKIRPKSELRLSLELMFKKQ